MPNNQTDTPPIFLQSSRDITAERSQDNGRETVRLFTQRGNYTLIRSDDITGLSANQWNDIEFQQIEGQNGGIIEFDSNEILINREGIYLVSAATWPVYTGDQPNTTIGFGFRGVIKENLGDFEEVIGLQSANSRDRFENTIDQLRFSHTFIAKANSIMKLQIYTTQSNNVVFSNPDFFDEECSVIVSLVRLFSSDDE